MAQDYELWALKIPEDRARQLDMFINLTKAGLVPGHVYKDRSALMRAGINKIIQEIGEALKNTDAVAIAVAELMEKATSNGDSALD